MIHGLNRPGRRWRSLVLVVVLVTVPALAAAVVFLDLAGRSALSTPDNRDLSHGKSMFPPGERLIPELRFVISQPVEQPPVDPEIPFFEVLADGSVHEVDLTMPGNTVVDQLRPLPDGRLVVRGSRDLMPEIDREDGPFVEGVAFPIMLVDANGDVTSYQDIRVAGEHVSMIGVSADDIILQRYALDSDGRVQKPVRITAHSLATGAERVLWETDHAASHGDVGGDWLLLAGGGIDDLADGAGDVPRCWLHRRDPTLDDKTVGNPPGRHAVPACHQIVDVNASPEGRFVALVYERWADPAELRLRILGLPNMEVLSDELLGTPASPCSECIATATIADYLGMAWSDAAVLHIARMESLSLPLDADGALADVQDRLRVVTRPTIG